MGIQNVRDQSVEKSKFVAKDVLKSSKYIQQPKNSFQYKVEQSNSAGKEIKGNYLDEHFSKEHPKTEIVNSSAT